MPEADDSHVTEQLNLLKDAVSSLGNLTKTTPKRKGAEAQPAEKKKSKKTKK